MEKLTVIKQQEVLGKDFKVYGDFENPLFLAKDICTWLEMDVSNASKLINNLDSEEYITTRYNNTSATFITEDGLYEVLMQSRKPIAKAFKKEVKAILKQVRQTGGFIPVNEQDTEQEILAKAMQIMNNTIHNQNIKLKTLEYTTAWQKQIICEMQPKASYVDMVLNNKGLVTITQIAKDYGMSGKKMNELLKEFKVQYKQSGQWLLYSKYHSLGYTHSKTINITRSNGEDDVVMETKWTQKGRLFIYELLKSHEIFPIIDYKVLA